MKRKIVNVNYTFKTGGNTYNESQIVTIKVDGIAKPKAEEIERLAVETVEIWFRATYPKSECIKISGRVPLEKTYFASVHSHNAEDGYSADLSVDRIEQLIEETKPYTDRLVLNGWAPV
jgi:hypothetical protein